MLARIPAISAGNEITHVVKTLFGEQDGTLFCLTNEASDGRIKVLCLRSTQAFHECAKDVGGWLVVPPQSQKW